METFAFEFMSFLLIETVLMYFVARNLKFGRNVCDVEDSPNLFERSLFPYNYCESSNYLLALSSY